MYVLGKLNRSAVIVLYEEFAKIKIYIFDKIPIYALILTVFTNRPQLLYRALRESGKRGRSGDLLLYFPRGTVESF
jgi:hypothetical protein